MRLLVSGAASGLGRYLTRRFDAVPLIRTTPLSEVVEQGRRQPFDAIVHCAASSRRGVTNRTLYRFLADNLLLTRDLCGVQHRQFIYVSSISVYPPDSVDTSPAAIIRCDEPHDLYSLTKLGGESIALEHGIKPLVLRLGGMLGADARPNSIRRILTEAEPTLTLAAESTFNYMLHQDIGDFLEIALRHGSAGTYNVAAGKNASLGEIAERFNKKVRWGSFAYRTATVQNGPAVELLPSLRRSTLENVVRYHAELASGSSSH